MIKDATRTLKELYDFDITRQPDETDVEYYKRLDVDAAKKTPYVQALIRETLVAYVMLQKIEENAYIHPTPIISVAPPNYR